jgi:glycogen debranching enzyme
MNDETESWRHTKPPVHGWVLRWMMSHSSSIDRKKLSEVYQPLCRWTDWFFHNRDADRDGLPEYNQGDDSGWDNTTIFLEPPPLETPDLAALLVIQMDVLSDVAAKLGKQQDALSWRKRSDELLQALIENYWRGHQLVALHAFDHKAAPTTSLILYLPLILGQQLPEPIRRQLIERLMDKGRFLTQHGFATEELSSPYYRSNGYWRGPIWAPTMMMLAQSLEDSGRADLARDMRLRFCRMVTESGFAENFNAVTGAGSDLPDLKKPDTDGRDPAYTWTSGVFLIFAQQLSSGGSSKGRQ